MNKSPKPSNSNGAHEPHEELRQQLWELAYDLLDDDAAAALRARVKSDPAIARLYAEVRLQTDLVAAASRVNDAGLTIAAGPGTNAQGNARERSKTTHQLATTRGAGAAAWTNWLAIGGTVALLVLLTIGLNQPQVARDSVAKVDDYFFTSFGVPAEMTEGLSQPVDIEAKSIDGSGVQAELEVRLIDGEGRETFREAVATAADGRTRVNLPGELLTPGSKLEVRPADDKAERDRSVSAPLNITPEEPQTVMLLEKPFARPGDKVRFSITRVKPFSKQTELPGADELMVESRTGDVVQPTWTTDPESRVVNGQFELPREDSLRDLAVRMRRQTRQDVPQDAKQRESVAVDSNGAASGALARLEKFYLDSNRESAEPLERQSGLPAGGPSRALAERALANRGLGPEMENAGPSAGGQAGGGGLLAPALPSPAAPSDPAKPSDQPNGLARRMVAGTTDAAPGGRDQAGAPKAAATRSMEKKLSTAPANAEAASAGLAPPAPAFAPAPAPAPLAAPGAAGAGPAAPAAIADRAADGRAPLGATEPEANLPKELRSEPRRPNPSSVEGEQLATKSQGVLSDAAKSELRRAAEIPASKNLADQSGIAVVKQGSNVVARKKIDSLAAAAQAKAELPPEAHGQLTYEFYAHGNDKRPLIRERFMQESGRHLQIAVDGLKDQYVPGEMVQLKLRVQDEQSRATPAAVGVRVWSDQAVRTTRAPLSLAAALEWEALREEESLALEDATTLAAAMPWPVPAELAAPGELPALQKQKQDMVASADKRAEEKPASGQPTTSQPTTSQPATNAPAPPAPPDGDPSLAFGAARQQDTQAPGQAAGTQTGVAQVEAAQVHAEQFQSDQSVLLAERIEVDNRVQVQHDYEMAVAAAQLQRNVHWQQFGRLLIWTAAGVLLILGLLLIARQPIRMAVLVPAVGLSIVCLAVGLAWFVPQEPAGLQLAWNTDQPQSATAISEGATTMAAPASMSAATVQPTEPTTAESVNGSATQPVDGYDTKPGATSNGQGEGGGRFAEQLGAPPPRAPALPAQVPSDPGYSTPQPPAVTSNARGGGSRELDEKFNRQNSDNGRGEPSPKSAADKTPSAKKEQAKDSVAASGDLPRGAMAGVEPGAKISGGPAMKGSGGFDAKAPGQRPQEQALAQLAEGELAPPDSIFWRPLSATDSDGTVTIEFTMPAISADYYLLIDAIGNGRIGHVQQLVRSRDSK